MVDYPPSPNSSDVMLSLMHMINIFREGCIANSTYDDIE